MECNIISLVVILSFCFFRAIFCFPNDVGLHDPVHDVETRLYMAYVNC